MMTPPSPHPKYKYIYEMNSETEVMLAQLSNIQDQQCMEITFHNSYVILEFVPSTVTLWTELSCSRKSYSNKVAPRLMSSLQIFYDRHHNRVDR